MGTIVPHRRLTRITSKVLIVALVASQFSMAWAGHRGGRSSAVGGISIECRGKLILTLEMMVDAAR